MVRSKMPGGQLTAEQWLIHDRLANHTNGTIRLTTRQGIQFHGVLKGGLRMTYEYFAQRARGTVS
jgi:sulfite reductase beta subunit-like hemoprotein